MLFCLIDNGLFAASIKESNLAKIPGRPPVTSLVDYQGFCGFSTPKAASETPVSSGTPAEKETPMLEDGKGREGFTRISPQEVVSKMREGWAPYVLDVRYAPVV